MSALSDELRHVADILEAGDKPHWASLMRCAAAQLIAGDEENAMLLEENKRLEQAWEQMTVDTLEKLWNAQADEYNKFDTLELEEIVEFAQEVVREACAKVCDKVLNESNNIAASVCAGRIRMQGNKGKTE